MTEQTQGEGIGVAAEELVECAVEERRILRYGGEKREAGAELEVIRAPKNVLDRAAIDSRNRGDAVPEAWSQQWMLEIGRSLCPARDGVPLREMASPKTAQLRQHKPHPVAFFPSGTQLRECLMKYRSLGIHKAL
jgi:hypothetical protein